MQSTKPTEHPTGENCAQYNKKKCHSKKKERDHKMRRLEKKGKRKEETTMQNPKHKKRELFQLKVWDK
jgi:hypothetical protein